MSIALDRAQVDRSGVPALLPGGSQKKPYGPDTCKQGYVWRETTPADHVCVTPATREQVRADNAQAAARRA
ncbi:hypothetical protein [Streptosporangium vulgare]|uniref:Uncharacterized protein n=1 Tax=Streptosporangium vulgare TaxID=46190 RepID=A0ABV5TLJ1_9ACTN